MSIIVKVYEDAYRDKITAMVAEARKVIGLSGAIREDLYDINGNYLDKGDLFLIAVDENDEVTGCLGYSRDEGTDEAFLHRSYIRADMKRQGIGTMMLEIMERHMREQGIKTVKVHLGAEKDKWGSSYSFYPKNGYVMYAERYMKKDIWSSR